MVLADRGAFQEDNLADLHKEHYINNRRCQSLRTQTRPILQHCIDLWKAVFVILLMQIVDLSCSVHSGLGRVVMLIEWHHFNSSRNWLHHAAVPIQSLYAHFLILVRQQSLAEGLVGWSHVLCKVADFSENCFIIIYDARYLRGATHLINVVWGIILSLQSVNNVEVVLKFWTQIETNNKWSGILVEIVSKKNWNSIGFCRSTTTKTTFILWGI